MQILYECPFRFAIVLYGTKTDRRLRSLTVDSSDAAGGVRNPYICLSTLTTERSLFWLQSVLIDSQFRVELRLDVELNTQSGTVNQSAVEVYDGPQPYPRGK